MTLLSGAAATLFFGSCGWLSVQIARRLSERITPFDDGPPSHEPPVALLIAGNMTIGLAVALRPATPAELIIAALCCCALTASWCTDAWRGIVPDSLTLLPLAALGAYACVRGAWPTLVWAAVPAAPFAVAAFLSKGRGMGWGDVKLVALGGLVLGAPLAIIACAVACVSAVIANVRKRERRALIAFAPYLAGAIGLTIGASALLQ